jgi:hypothetical protein
MRDEEIEIRRAQLKEDIRVARTEFDHLVKIEASSEERMSDHQAGRQLAFENVKAAETALLDFEAEYPMMP